MAFKIREWYFRSYKYVMTKQPNVLLKAIRLKKVKSFIQIVNIYNMARNHFNIVQGCQISWAKKDNCKVFPKSKADLLKIF